MDIQKLRDLMEDDELIIHDVVSDLDKGMENIGEILKYFSISKKLLFRLEAFLETVLEENFCPPIKCSKKECATEDGRKCWLEYITKRVGKKETGDG